MGKEREILAGKIGGAVGFLLYRLLEILDGERLKNFRIIPYRRAEALKILSLELIERGER